MRMIQLIAENKENGYGVIFDGHVHYLLKQPFVLDNKIFVAAEQIEDLKDHGFEVVDYSFADLLQVQKHLSKMLADTRSVHGKTTKPYNPADYYLSLPTKLIELSIKNLVNHQDDYQHMEWVHDCLQKNPRFHRISDAARAQLQEIMEQSREKDYHNSLKEVFPFVQQKSISYHREIRIGFVHRNQQSLVHA